MPNWCANSLELEGTPEQIKKIKDSIPDNNLFKSILPIPEDLTRPGATTFGPDKKFDKIRKENLKKHGYESWYDFCIATWGTKWDAAEIEVISESESSIVLTFDTAWSPPIGIYEELVHQGYSVVAAYVEQGCNFIGVYENGIDVCTDFIDQETLDNIDSDDDYMQLSQMQDERMEEFFDLHNIDYYPMHTGG